MKDPAIVAYFDGTDSISLAQIGPKQMPAFIEAETAIFRMLFVNPAHRRIDLRFLFRVCHLQWKNEATAIRP